MQFDFRNNSVKLTLHKQLQKTFLCECICAFRILKQNLYHSIYLVFCTPVVPCTALFIFFKFKLIINTAFVFIIKYRVGPKNKPNFFYSYDIKSTKYATNASILINS